MVTKSNWVLFKNNWSYTNLVSMRIQEANRIVMAGESVCNLHPHGLIIRPTYGQLLKQFKAKNATKENNRSNQHRRTHFNNRFANA